MKATLEWHAPACPRTGLRHQIRTDGQNPPHHAPVTIQTCETGPRGDEGLRPMLTLCSGDLLDRDRSSDRLGEQRAVGVAG